MSFNPLAGLRIKDLTIRLLYSFDVYCCGPAPFMAKMISGFTEMGVPAEQLHYEYFGPLRSTASVLAKEAAREAKTTQSAHV